MCLPLGFYLEMFNHSYKIYLPYQAKHNVKF